MPNAPKESEEHALWREEMRDAQLYAQRFEACFTHLCFNAPTVPLAEIQGRAQDFASGLASADRRAAATLREVGAEPAYSDEQPEAPAPTTPPAELAPLRANPNPAMNFGAWQKTDQRAY